MSKDMLKSCSSDTFFKNNEITFEKSEITFEKFIH